CTALGKVLLAFLEPEEVAHFFTETELVRRTPRTITSRMRLAHEFAAIRRTGFAVDDEEVAENLCCVGVPIHGPPGRVGAALSVAVPKMRFRAALVPAWVRQLEAAATAIARQLGFVGG